MKTIFITGASTGIGKETALLFSKKGWNVVATMRNPDKEQDLQTSPNILILKLDVTDINSIKIAIDEAINKFDKIDVILNNAGYSLVGIFEAMSQEQIKKQFDTNVFGAMNVIKEILPHFRARKKGIILNVTSMGGLVTFPLYSVYHATKWALEGFAESLYYELKPHNILIKNIEPGAIKTDFYKRSMEFISMNEYEPYASNAHQNMLSLSEMAPGPKIVAKVIYKAAKGYSKQIRYPVGNNAPLILLMRRLLPLGIFMRFVKLFIEKGFGVKKINLNINKL